jgi:hypothetical protein
MGLGRVEARPNTPVACAVLPQSARISGKALLALVRGEIGDKARLQRTNGHSVEPSVVMVQIIKHATEHRE